MPCKEIVLQIDLSDTSIVRESIFPLYDNPVACLRESLGLIIDVLFGEKPSQKSDGIICSGLDALVLLKDPKFKKLFIACAVNITSKKQDAEVSFRELARAGVKCFVVGTPVVCSPGEVNNLLAFLLPIIRDQIKPELPEKKSKRFFLGKILGI